MSVEQNLHTGPAAAPAGVRMTAGIDWASADHAVAIVDGAGVTLTGSASRTAPRSCAGW
jgi:hypothetical protein